MSKMLALVKEKAGPGARLVEVRRPQPKQDELLLKVRATSICGTDLHIYKWDPWAASTVTPPLVFGHEFAAEVAEIGPGVQGFQLGDTVAVESHVPCLSCLQCRGGRRYICDRLKIIGVHRPGCFAEYITIPALCAWKVSPKTPLEIASVMEPLGNAVHAVNVADVEGKRIAIFGCGPIGLFAVSVCRAQKAERIVAVETLAGRRALSRAAGALQTIDGSRTNVVDLVRGALGKRGADVVLEMSGNPDAFRSALACTRKGGTLVAFGLMPEPINLDLSNEVVLSARRIVGVVGRRLFETWEEMQEMLDSGRLNPKPIITHRFTMGDYEQAFGILQQKDRKVGKVVMYPPKR